MIRIGYDAKRLFQNFTGLGNYSRTLLRNLAFYYPDQAYFLFTPREIRNPDTKFFSASASFSVETPAAYQRPLWRSYGLRYRAKRRKIQLYHGLSNELPYDLGSTGIKTVVTIHDLVFKYYPQYYPVFDRLVYDSKFKYACQHADLVVAISESTKNDIVNFYGIAPEKIQVIYQSCDERFQQEKSKKLIEQTLKKYHLPSEFLLNVGSVNERKNLLGIVQAIQLLPADLQLPLVVVGEGQTYKNKVLQYLREQRIEKQVQFVQVDNEDLPALYQQARLFIYPSLYEGFGIPILEALCSGTPVLSSNLSSLPEAAGPDAMLVDPRSPDSIAAGISKTLTDEALRKKMTSAGYAHAQKFNGESLSRQMMDAYAGLLGGWEELREPR